MTFAAVALMASGSGYSGCLLGTRIVDDDADLRPFQPPVVTESTIDGSNAPPGTMYIVPRDTGTGIRRVTIDATIMTASQGIVGARWYLDRQRPCNSPSTCGSPLASDPLPPPANGDSPNTRHTTVEVDLAPQHCSVVDLFVASEFKGFPLAEQHEPVRAGEFGFARWFIVRFDPATPIPFSDCVRETL